MTRLAALVAAGVAGVLVTAAPAVAAPVGSVGQVRVAPDATSVSFTFDALGLRPGAGLDPETVVVEVAGRRVAARATPSRTVTTAVPTRVVLAVDTSGSMRGTALLEARRAATEFRSAGPAGAAVGLVTFATAPRVVVAPTTDRRAVLAALSRLTAAGETSLYDAVTATLAALGPAGPRRVVLLSDGGDTASRTTLAGAVAAVRASGAVVEAVGLQTDEATTDSLTQLATAGSGRVLRVTNGRQLAAALVSTARTSATQLQVTAVLPDQVWAENAPLTVRVASSGGVLAAAATMQLPRPAVGATTAPSETGSRALLLGLGALAVALMLATVALAAPVLDDRRRMQRLVSRFTTTAPQEPEHRGVGDSAVARTALGLADRVAESKDLRQRLDDSLERAAVAFTPAEWILLQAGAGFAAVAVGFVLGLAAPLSLALGLLVGLAAPAAYLRHRAHRRQVAFLALLPDTLQLLSGSLSAGYSLEQAVDAVVSEGSEPMATELRRALAEARIGVPVVDALESVAERMQCRDFAWAVMAIRVQREVGGNLAEVLATVAGTLRERVQLHRQVRALSAEGRLSAYILLALPICLALYMLAVRADYIRPLYTTAVGLTMIVAAVGLMTVGAVWMRNIVKVDL